MVANYWKHNASSITVFRHRLDCTQLKIKILALNWEGFFANRMQKNWLVFKISNFRTAFPRIAMKGQFHVSYVKSSLIDLNSSTLSPVIAGFAGHDISFGLLATSSANKLIITFFLLGKRSNFNLIRHTCKTFLWC